MTGYFISGTPTVNVFEAAELGLLESATRTCTPAPKPA